jgi:uncharacterized membrane protein
MKRLKHLSSSLQRLRQLEIKIKTAMILLGYNQLRFFWPYELLNI